MEVWKCYPNYPEYYISSYGNVKSKMRIGYGLVEKGMLNPTLANTGYYVCKNILVHRMVAITFVPNPHNYPFVDHIDGNKLNNRVENLRWASASTNARNRHDLDEVFHHIQYEVDRNLWCFRARVNGVTKRARFEALYDAILYRNQFFSDYPTKPSNAS